MISLRNKEQLSFDADTVNPLV